MFIGIVKEIAFICIVLIVLIFAIKSCIQEVIDIFKAQIYLFKAILDKKNQANEVFIVFNNNIKKLNYIRKIKKEQKKHRDMWNKAIEKWSK